MATTPRGDNAALRRQVVRNLARDVVRKRGGAGLAPLRAPRKQMPRLRPMRPLRKQTP